MFTTDTFLAAIEAYLVEHGMPPATFGRAALDNSAFVFRLRKGRSPTLATVEKVLAYMQAKGKRRAA